jgi:hypothetical protein
MVRDPERFVRGRVRDGVARLTHGEGARPAA